MGKHQKKRGPISEETRQKLRLAKLGKRGADTNRWKGGIAAHTSGYLLIKDHDHPNALANGYVLAHRWVMSKVLGRPLRTDEIVHHKNGNKTDNRPENLEVMTSIGDHTRLHLAGKPLSPDQRERLVTIARAVAASRRGAKHSEESLQKMRDAQAQRRAEETAGTRHVNPRGGWHLSEETKAKISAARRAYFERKSATD